MRSRFLRFFEKRGHKIIPSASLVPQNDPSVLFNTAGMQPLVPYLLGEKHPIGKRLASIQKCVRTVDLVDIGDNRHLSFFEMMGNWSLGDYFKEDAIKWSYEFLTNGNDKKEGDKGLGLEKSRLYITVFEGNKNAPRDIESFEIWKSLGIPEDRIYFLGEDDNWWSPGDNGPCGPCTEMFYDMLGNTGDLNKEQFLSAVKREDVIEIWNDVFMEYEKKDGIVIGKLKQKNVDTGAGLERMTAVMQNKKTAYDTDLFEASRPGLPGASRPGLLWRPGLEIQGRPGLDAGLETKAKRIIADHVRTSTFLLADGVLPENTGRGYVLRRLLRRAILFSNTLNLQNNSQNNFQDNAQNNSQVNLLSLIAEEVIDKFKEFYPELNENSEIIRKEIDQEEERFKKTLEKGLAEFNKNPNIDPFILATTYGFPFELVEELAKEKGIKIDRVDFDTKMQKHQELSRTASAGMFKGGLADHSEKTIRLHTTHHLLLASLQKVLGKDVKQRGSNITQERLRIDFSFARKMTEEEKKQVEDMVNQKINEKLPVTRYEIPKEKAEKLGAEMEFGVKYSDIVSVYAVGSDRGVENFESRPPFSLEFCGGPHVKNTSELGCLNCGKEIHKHFQIVKEEAISQGIRRIKAILKI